MQHDQPSGKGRLQGGEERAELAVPDRRALELVGEDRRGLQLERHAAPPDVRRRRRVGRVHLDPSAQVPRGDARQHVLDPQQRRHGHLETWRDPLARRLGLRPLAGGLQLGGERRPDGRPDGSG